MSRSRKQSKFNQFTSISACGLEKSHRRVKNLSQEQLHHAMTTISIEEVNITHYSRMKPDGGTGGAEKMRDVP